jgi:hypothetical protein
MPVSPKPKRKSTPKRRDSKSPKRKSTPKRRSPGKKKQNTKRGGDDDYLLYIGDKTGRLRSEHSKMYYTQPPAKVLSDEDDDCLRKAKTQEQIDLCIEKAKIGGSKRKK